MPSLSVKTKQQKGLTIIELLVSVTIFAIISVGAFGVFSSILRGKSSVGSMQQGVEDISLTVDQVLKDLRMTSFHAGTLDSVTSSVVVDENADSGSSKTYCFNANSTLTVQSGTSCGGGSVVAQGVDGNFYIRKQVVNASSSANDVPTYTITMIMQKTGKPETRIQSSVTLRDYAK